MPQAYEPIVNVVLYVETWEQHLSDMEQFFEKLRVAGLAVNLPKSEIGKAFITYLGYVVGQEKVRLQTATVQAIVKLSVPQNRRELMHFLGMCGF